jgi:hypothetical protein
MGLDQYLSVSKGLYKVGDNDKEYNLNRKIKSMFPEIKEASTTGNLEYVHVTFEVGYWRKANAIHQWFVDNCQDGDDDCRKYNVERDELKELLELCKEVKSDHSKAELLLPTSEGFFFGTYEYDEWYFRAIDDTIEIIEKCLKIPDNEGWEFYYQSSW